MGTRGLQRDRVGQAGLLGALALMWVAPFLWTVHRFPMASLDSELVAASCLGFALLSCGLLHRRDLVMPWPLPAAIATLAAIVLIQWGLGLLAYPQQAIRFLLFAGAMLTAYVVGRQIVAADRLTEATSAFCAAASLGGIYSALVQWLQLLQLQVLPYSLAVVYDEPILRARPFGNLAQANHQASYLALAALAVLYLNVRARRFWFVPPGLCLLASGLAMTGSRMALVFLVLIVVLLYAPTALRPASLKARMTSTLILIGGYAIGLASVRLLNGQTDTISRFAQDTFPIRLELWSQALKISWQHALLGVGVGQFGAAQYWVARAGPYTYAANNCHNLPLMLAVEFGWPAALTVTALALAWGLRKLRSRLASAEQALIWCMVLAIAIHSMLEFPLWHAYFAIPFACLIALGEPSWRSWPPVDARRILAISGVTVLGVSAAIVADYEPVAIAAAPFWLESNHIRHRSFDDALTVYTVADSRLFRPEVDRLVIDLAHPPDEATVDPLARRARVMRLLPAPEVIAPYIAGLATQGRIQEAIIHVRRLRVFAGTSYPDYRDWLLNETRDLGPQSAPLRHELRQSACAAAALHPMGC